MENRNVTVTLDKAKEIILFSTKTFVYLQSNNQKIMFNK